MKQRLERTKIQHVISTQQFLDLKLLERLFRQADRFRNNKVKKSLAGKTLATIFYEPSTRTRLSFEAAMYRLGGNVLTSEQAGISSSAAKGETLEDAVRVLSAYADAIVLRHPEIGAAERAARVSNVPMINAGDGAGEHPTQALLDLYTLQRHLGSLSGKTIALMGDLLYGRTVHSLLQLLSLYPALNVILISPKELRLPKQYSRGLNAQELQNIRDLSQPVDALYVTRLQRERFADPRLYTHLKADYKIDQAKLQHLKSEGIIMHPLPRAGEIAPEVDSNPRAIYFEQAENGVYVRMALLKWLLA